MRTLILLFAFLLIFNCKMLLQDAARPPKAAPAPAAKDLTPSAAQLKDLKLAQDAAIIATQKLQLLQQQVQQAEMGRQQALAALNAQAEAIKKENKWDATTQFDPNDLKFSPKAAEKTKP